LPMQHLGARWPAGLQLCAAPSHDRRLLAVAATIKAIIGRAAALAG